MRHSYLAALILHFLLERLAHVGILSTAVDVEYESAFGGMRISELFKMKGLPQEYLAKSIHISRPSLAQIELGNRSVGKPVLQKLSMVLKFS